MGTNLLTGILYFIVGTLFALGAQQYVIGTPSHMGAGFLPFYLGIILATLGVIIVAVSFLHKHKTTVQNFKLRPLIFIIGGNLIFGITLAGLPLIGLPPLGLIIAIYSTILVVSFADGQFVLLDALKLSTILSACSYLLFVEVLRLPIQILPWIS